MNEIRDWRRYREMWIRVLEKQTGEGLDKWNRRIKKESFEDKQSLRAWLTEQDVTGYARSLLLMERFGYPDFLLASADELIEGQYVDRPQLRPIFDAVISASTILPNGTPAILADETIGKEVSYGHAQSAL